jgi:hypothetical protein
MAIAEDLAAEGGEPGTGRLPAGGALRSGRTRSSTAAAAPPPQETSDDVDTAYQHAMRKWQV